MKKMNYPVLSICIATYNRCEFISQTLDSIVWQINKLNVEIIIVDGASTDNTEDIVRDFIIRYPQIRYIKLQRKGGVDQDYAKAVEFATGKMCWLFTDDDLLRPYLLEKIVNYCKLNYSLIILNSEVRNISLEKKLTDRMLKIKNDLILNGNELNNLFTNVIPYISFIGAIIINRFEWNERNKEDYFNSEFIHVGVIFQNVFKNKILIIAEPYIVIRLGNAQWSSRSYEIWLIKWPKLIQTFNLISQKTRSTYTTSPSLRRYRDILVQRSKGSYNFSIFKKWHLFEKSNIFWKILLLFAAFIPIFLLKKIITFYLKRKKIDNLNYE